MIIYRVASNFLKGVQEFEIIKIEDGKTFTYEKDLGFKKIIRTRPFEKQYPNDSNYFKSKEDAMVFLRKKLKQAIKKNKEMIDKYELFLNAL